MYQPNTPITDDVLCRTLGVKAGGQITISQDLPYRTEICAIYGHARTEHV